MATLYKNGNEETIAPKKKKFTGKEIYEYLECETFQVVFGSKYAFLCDDSGFIKGREPNEQPTILAYKDRAIYPDDYFNGPVIICTRKEVG